MTDEETEKEAKEYSQGNFYSEQGFYMGMNVVLLKAEKKNALNKIKMEQFVLVKS